MSEFRQYIDKDGNITLQYLHPLDNKWVDVPEVFELEESIKKESGVKKFEDWIKEQADHDSKEQTEDAQKVVSENPEIYQNYLEFDNIATINILSENAGSYIELTTFVDIVDGKLSVCSDNLWFTIKNEKLGIDENWDNPHLIVAFLAKLDKWGMKHTEGKLKTKIHTFLEQNAYMSDDVFTKFVVDNIDDFISVYHDAVKAGIICPKEK